MDLICCVGLLSRNAGAHMNDPVYHIVSCSIKHQNRSGWPIG